jgi:Flp pilus assembly protein TadG
MQNLVKSAIASLAQCAKKFAKNKKGNVGMLFGLSVIPVMLAAGSAIDYSRVANAKSNLIAGLDSSALYAAAITGKTEAEMKDLARVYLDKNYANTGDAELTNFELHNYADRVEVNGTVKVKTWFMSVGGITNVDVNANSQIMKAGNSIEVSLVLDVTGSMAGTKLTSLQNAANDFIDTVVWDTQTPYYSKVAVIPFSEGVNMAANADAARGTLTAGTCTTPGCQIYKVTTGSGKSKVTTNYVATNCVTERTGAQAYTDGAVSGSKVGRLYDVDTSMCNGIQPLVPLTSDRTVLHSTVNALVAGGGTAGQVGMAWGWYTISPTFGLWTGASVPAAYPAAGVKLKKIAVFMTDGDFNVSYCNGLQDGVVCSATNGDETTQAQTLCTAMKAKDITIYTIGFQLSGSTAINFMHNCATDSTKSYDAANEADLQAAFSAIAQNLLELRVSR